MKILHLSDDDIQRYVFDTSDCEYEIIEHIRSCDHCKIRAASYELISASIQNEQAPVFDFNLSELVIDQLPQKEKPFSVINVLTYFLLITCVGILGLTFYYFNGQLIGLLDNISAITIYFILSVTGLIFVPLYWDIYHSFDKKIKIVELS